MRYQKQMHLKQYLLVENNNLNNLVCVIDNNNSQIRSLPTSNLHQKLKAFGLEVIEVDGHNIDELTEALNQKGEKPLAIVANTIKGKGIKERNQYVLRKEGKKK